MSKSAFSWPLFNRVPVIGIIRKIAFDDVNRIIPVYVESGLNTIEITINTERAEELIRHTLDQYPTGLNVGAGTVCTEEDLERALAAGAQFIVTPIISKKVISACVAKNIPVFPGAFSPTEIYDAWSAGASMVKLYPARTLGPDYIKDVKAPLDKVKLLPTGGIDLDNITSFRKAGADGFGIGSQLFDKKLIDEKNVAGLKKHFQQFVEKVVASI